jgi:hypothetical protein
VATYLRREVAVKGQVDDVEVVALLAVIGWFGAMAWLALGKDGTIAAPMWFVLLPGPALAWLLGRAVWRWWRRRGGE